MGINESSALFDTNLKKLIKESNLPVCVIRLELLNVFNDIDIIYQEIIKKESEVNQDGDKC